MKEKKYYCWDCHKYLTVKEKQECLEKKHTVSIYIVNDDKSIKEVECINS